jgi:hypothetical protein
MYPAPAAYPAAVTYPIYPTPAAYPAYPAYPAPRPAPAPAPAPAMAITTWAPTHTAPAEGLAFWATPDPSRPPAGQLVGRVELVVEATTGAWALVRGANGWRGWVDGRCLLVRG